MGTSGSIGEPLVPEDPRGPCEESGELIHKGTWGADLKDIIQLAGPAILQLSFQQAVIVTNQSMAGASPTSWCHRQFCISIYSIYTSISGHPCERFLPLNDQLQGVPRLRILWYTQPYD